MIIRLKSQNADYPDLSPEQRYFVLGIEAGDYRILNDSGKPYLYPPELFEVLDATEPADWITNYGEDGERYSYPALLNSIGFFEDYFEQKPRQTSIFWQLVNERLARAA